MAVRGALSRYYDEIRPRTGVLPADVPKHIADEFARAQPIYQLLWDHFTGKHWLKRDGQNRYQWPLRINYSQAAFFIHASVWAGDMPDTSDPVVKPIVEIGDRGNKAKWGDQATDALQQVWYENHGRALLLNANVICQALGGVVLKLRWEPSLGWRRRIPIRIEAVTPDVFVGIPDGSDLYDLLEAYVIREIPLAQAEKEFGYVPTRQDRNRDTAQMVERWDRYTYRITINGQTAVFRNRPQEGPNQWGFVPMVYFPHLRYAGTFAGIPLFAQLMGLAEELNGRMADEGDAILQNIHSVPWVSNVREKIKLDRVGRFGFLNLGTGSAITGAPAMGSFPSPELSGEARDFNSRLDAMIKGLLFTPEIAWGSDPGSQRSAESRDRPLLPLTMHINMERAHWTPGLNVLSEMMLQMIARSGQVGDHPGISQRHLGHRIHQVWHPLYPADRAKPVDEMAVRAQAYLASPELALQQFGDVEDIDATIRQIKDSHE